MKIIYLLLFFFTLSHLSAQDVHFAHIHASPTILNPAMTGMINKGNVRFIANARSQWESVTNGYKTMAASVDGKLFNTGYNHLGGGLQFTGDKAGDLGLSKLSTGFTLSGLKGLDGKGRHYISVGLRGSIYHYSVDYNKLVGFDTEPLVAAGAPDAFSFFDLSAGVAWYHNYNRDNTVYVGGALFHINKPNTSFFSRLENADISNAQDDYYGYEQLYRKFVFHGGGTFKVGENVTLLPSFLFMDQGPHQEINTGTFVKYVKGQEAKQAESSFYIGAWFRYHIEKDIVGSDAIIAAIRMDIKNTYFTFSFDVNLSSLSVASYGAGGPELSVIQVLSLPKDRTKNYKVRCPAF